MGKLCKLGIGKAYDCMILGFIFQTVHKMGFREKLIKWIGWCLSITDFLILINGTSRHCHS